MSPSIAISSCPASSFDVGLLSNSVQNGISAKVSSSTALKPLLASALTIKRTTNPKPIPSSPLDPCVVPQSYATDHMLTATWSDKTGWESPRIEPYGPLSLMPTASCLHYATECFEGMKVYRGLHDGKLRLFRPDCNAARMLKSARRIALPDFDPKELLELIKRFVGFEMTKWLPDTHIWRGRFLYLRPLMMGTGDALGVQRPREAMLVIMAVFMPDLDISTPVPQALANEVNGDSQGSSAEQTTKGMRLIASTADMIRAWPGGVGGYKVGGNYGATLLAQGEAKARGFDQVLWLFGPEGYITEAGASNIFVLWRRPQDGKIELMTSSLDDQTILEGVTRASVLKIAQDLKFQDQDVIVTERRFTIDEVDKSNEQGGLLEVFVCGTAFFVAAVSEIEWKGQSILFPLGTEEKVKGVRGNEYAMAIKETLKGIMYGYGKDEHNWGSVVTEWDE